MKTKHNYAKRRWKEGQLGAETSRKIELYRTIKNSSSKKENKRETTWMKLLPLLLPLLLWWCFILSLSMPAFSFFSLFAAAGCCSRCGSAGWRRGAGWCGYIMTLVVREYVLCVCVLLCACGYRVMVMFHGSCRQKRLAQGVPPLQWHWRFGSFFRWSGGN